VIGSVLMSNEVTVLAHLEGLPPNQWRVGLDVAVGECSWSSAVLTFRPVVVNAKGLSQGANS
jgi:hypothetical protein